MNTLPLAGQFDDAPDHDGEQHNCLTPTLGSAAALSSNFSPKSVLEIPEGKEPHPLVKLGFPNLRLSLCSTQASGGNIHEDREQADGEVITKLNVNDVLCGRGKGPNNHVGNCRFRELVREQRVAYLATSSRQEKGLICAKIIETVQNANPPGRFLKKTSQNGKAAWEKVDNRKAMLKTGQALREGVTKEMIGRVHQTYGTDLVSSLTLLSRNGILEPKMRLLPIGSHSFFQQPPSYVSNQGWGQHSLLSAEQRDEKKMTPKQRLIERALTESDSVASSDSS